VTIRHSCSISDIGSVRRRNEDAFCAAADIGFYAVADGVGGAAGGDVASRIAVDVAETFLREAFAGRPHMAACFCEDTSAIGRLLGSAVSGANTAVYHESIRLPSLSGMCTTFAAALFQDDRIAISHVGDSRIYRLRSGVLSQLTEDHTLAQEQFRRGLLSRSELLACDYRNIISRVVGVAPAVEAASAEYTVEEGDRYLLCTDGLSNMLSHEEIQSIMAEGAAPEELCTSLLAAALHAGGHDNITAIAVLCR
jgi:protein phosphatase